MTINRNQLAVFLTVAIIIYLFVLVGNALMASLPETPPDVVLNWVVG